MATPVSVIQKQHIAGTPGVCDGKPCIAGTRIRVQDVVIRTELGDSADDIVRAYPHITLADVHAALSYYHDNRDEIDQQIRDDEAMVDKLKSQSEPGLLERLNTPGRDAEVSPR